jgi:16S rRNA (cytosine1402-N4)-methyltransferase
MEWLHEPVLLTEVIDFINVLSGGAYVDLTFGEGGHSEAILEKGAQSVWAFDRDLSAIEQYQKAGKYREDSRLKLTHSQFSRFLELSKNQTFDGILIDLGVSTRQLLSQERGFTFQKKGPLDMRMDQSQGPTLKELLETLSEEELAEILWKNADMKGSYSVARKILKGVQEGNVHTTEDLAQLMGPRWGKSHPATVPFMALRMAVNQELEQISETVPALIDRLKPGGRLVVITFHSTEDRLVKRIFQKLAGKCICKERICLCSREERVKILTKKPVEATQEELQRNPRSRSAKLRCVEKLS